MATYETKIHHVEGGAGGDAIEVESGGTITVKSGGQITVDSGGTLDSTGSMDVQSGGDIAIKSGATIDVESGATLTIESGATIAIESGGVLDMQAGSKQTTPIVNITTSRVVTVAESGTVFFLKAVDLKMTLPSTAVGLTYTFIVHTVSSSTGAQIDPASADAIHNAGDTSVDDKDMINTPATDTEGDSITLLGDGVDGWWVTAITGIWAKEA